MSSLSSIIMTPPVVFGHWNLSFSRRFCHKQNPFLSQYSIFMMVLLRLQNTKRCPLNGSRSNRLSTIILNPFMDFLISVYPRAMYTFTPDIDPNITSHHIPDNIFMRRIKVSPENPSPTSIRYLSPT